MLKTLSVTMKVLAYLIAILAISSMVTSSIPGKYMTLVFIYILII